MDSSRDPNSEPPFRLSREERGLIPARYDVAMVERVLSQLPADLRPFLVRYLAATAARSFAEAATLLPDVFSAAAEREAARASRGSQRAFLPPQPSDLSLNDPALDALLRALGQADTRRRPTDR